MKAATVMALLEAQREILAQVGQRQVERVTQELYAERGARNAVQNSQRKVDEELTATSNRLRQALERARVLREHPGVAVLHKMAAAQRIEGGGAPYVGISHQEWDDLLGLAAYIDPFTAESTLENPQQSQR